MARARAAGTAIVWPAGLAVCEPSDWIREGDDLDDPIVPGYVCWMRWVDARYQLLIQLGARRDDAQFDAVGDFPATAKYPEAATSVGLVSTNRWHRFVRHEGRPDPVG